jgi:hypothetical protein
MTGNIYFIFFIISIAAFILGLLDELPCGLADTE